jgi:hypothetical protein
MATGAAVCQPSPAESFHGLTVLVPPRGQAVPAVAANTAPFTVRGSAGAAICGAVRARSGAEFVP